ncbi:hypothetical protein Holit_03348 [Hollandina sp. SP2]
MQENIQIPEVLIVLFLVLPAIRPYIRGLQSQDGLIWFPLVALVTGVGFPHCLSVL